MGGCFSTKPGLEEVLQSDVEIPLPDFEKRWKDDIHEIWERPIAKLPAHTDVPRLCKKITLHHNENVVFDGTEATLQETPNSQVTKLLFVATAKALNDEHTQDALKVYDKYVSDTGDTGEQLVGFFTYLTETHGETYSLLVFKAIHQRLIFPAFYCMKDLLQPTVGRFKDQRGSWVVAIKIIENTVIVKHKKRQQAINMTQNNPDFEFTWQLTLTMNTKNQTMSMKDTQIELSDIQINDALDKTLQEEFQECFDTHTVIQ